MIIDQRVNDVGLQEEILKLQRGLIAVQHTQVQAIRREICEDVSEIVEEAVKEGVQDSLNGSIRSYSDAAQSGSGQSSAVGGAVFSQETLKKVVKRQSIFIQMIKSKLILILLKM